MKTKNNRMQECWLSVEEIAAYQDVNCDTGGKWLMRKMMSGHKAGWLWKLPASEVDQWVKHGLAGQKES